MADHRHPVNLEGVAAVSAHGLPAADAHRMAEFLAVLADPLRARIVAGLLVVDELCVGDLALALGATEDAVSYALRQLRTAGLVRRRRQGRVVYYQLGSAASRHAVATALSATRGLARHDPGTANG